MNQHDVALRAESVWSRYGRRRAWALKDVSFEVPSGSITALVGPNGAGKSTLIKSWIGLERPARGRVAVAGIDPRTDRRAAVDRVGYVSQSLGLYRSLPVIDHLRMAWTLRGAFDIDAAASRLAALSIPLHANAGHLSGGQQAQVALALALGSRSPVLLLDEPLAALDPLARHEFMRVVVDDVRGRGATALISSHILNDIAFAADRLLMLTGGRLILAERVDRLLDEHRLIPDTDREPGPLVAAFHRPGGRRVKLVRSNDPALEPPTLEELVMGHLAAALPSTLVEA
jgi:ABC-2 type transport system ATP-binding protein